MMPPVCAYQIKNGLHFPSEASFASFLRPHDDHSSRPRTLLQDNESLFAEQIEKFSRPGNSASYVLADVSINEQIGQSYRLAALGSSGIPPTAVTSLAVHMLLGKQDARGNWNSYSHRPPLEDSRVTATAITIRALRLFATPDRAGEITKRIELARKWLASVQPVSTEESTMKLLGLAWAGADLATIKHAADPVLREQRPDGGWAQIPNRESDAYATGEVVVALNQAAQISSDDARVVRAMDFLLRTQKTDGTWLVETRRTFFPGLPYFESGFPYGKHQFISYAATAWASMALMVGGGSGVSDVLMGSPKQTSMPAPGKPDLPPLVRAALEGTPQDLKTALAQGGDVNARWTDNGLTALMCAAYNADKVKMLIAAGADVNAATKQGHTALMLAAGYFGAKDSVRTLLEHGADPNAVTARERVQNALRMATMRGDVEVISMLLEHGAKINDLPTGSTAMVWAAPQGDQATVAYLLSRGARADSRAEWSGYPLTGLTGAIIAGSPETVSLLLSKGAPVNQVLSEGWTPLLDAAAEIDRDDTRIIESLLAGGADVSLRTSDGQTALALAEKSGNTAAAKLLRNAENGGIRRQ
jgi:ankyrin repeat protein